MADELAGKIAVITGGGSGIGRALCLGLARAGADIAAGDANRGGAEATAAMVEELGRRSLAVEVDVSDAAQAGAMAEQTLAALGRIDVLVNCAGIWPRHPFAEVTEAEWRRVLDVNLTGMFLCCKAIVPHMIRQGNGKIVNIASLRGVYGGMNGVHYSASKGGVIAFTVALGMELGAHGINVNAVCPGGTDTPLWRGYRDPGWQPPMDRPPHQRIEAPEEVVGPVLFLTTEASRTMFGQVIYMKAP